MSDTSWTPLDELLAKAAHLRGRIAVLRAAGDEGDEYDRLHDELWDVQMDIEELATH